ncbi:LamG-like jellyroll fold domain-containing protein [Sunxiuqinia sp. A32]|uniref:LamG-like jellyroll fold domain-containing protein n=1 Tax=Sunxiuqinia sp. A32 TaxID=3461496 RepID=UPI004046242A
MKNLLQHWLRFKPVTSIVHIFCLNAILVFCLLALFSMEIQAQTPVLKHSYTFDDGTANDIVGEANGIKNGGEIINGEYVTFSEGQFIVLPADKININNFKSLSLEVYLGAGHLNAFFTMFSYFGNSVGDFGTDYIFQSLTNGGNSVTAISCKNSQTPWAVGTDVKANELKDSKYHHVVSTFDNHEIKFYIDGLLVSTNTIDQFPYNTIGNLSNQFAYLCKSGYRNDATWFGTIDQFNIYEGILDPVSIADSAQEYLEDHKELSEQIKEILSDVLVNPGFRPESELSSTFIKTYKQSKFVVYPTIIRTPDSTTWSQTSAKSFSELLQSKLKLSAEYKENIIAPGELQGQSQFDFFNNDMSKLASAIKENESNPNYYVMLEILFPPQQSESVNVFGIHIFVLNNKGENAFSFLLNGHHDYFSYNNLFAENSNTENLEKLKLKCTSVAIEALKKQIKYAESEIVK